jgi:serpin B
MTIKSIFTNEATLDKIFTGKKGKVDNLLHKTILSVDEVGTVAVGAAVMKIISFSMPINPPEFIANRPFIFFIRSGPTIMFIGQYVE